MVFFLILKLVSQSLELALCTCHLGFCSVEGVYTLLVELFLLFHEELFLILVRALINISNYLLGCFIIVKGTKLITCHNHSFLDQICGLRLNHLCRQSNYRNVDLQNRHHFIFHYHQIFCLSLIRYQTFHSSDLFYQNHHYFLHQMEVPLNFLLTLISFFHVFQVTFNV